MALSPPFESLIFILKNKLLIYRPPKLISGFIQEFSDLLSVIILKYDRVVILGDFNIYVCCPSSSSFAFDFISLFDTLSLIQHVKQLSHDKRHTLDLVISHGFCVDDSNLMDFAIFDHNAMLFQVLLLSPDHKPATQILSHP